MALKVAEPSVGLAWAKRVPVTSPLVSGRKVTLKLQLAFGARPEQGGPLSTNWRGIAMLSARDLTVRLLMVNGRVRPRGLVGLGPKWAWAGGVWGRRCWVGQAPVGGRWWVGVERGGGVGGAVNVPTGWAEAGGAKTIWRKHVAEAARTPEQGAPPVGAAERLKSPEIAGGVMVIGLEVRLVRVKRMGALTLCNGTVPKSCVAGARMRPSEGRPVPVSVRVYGPPEGLEVRFK